ncbi:DNA-binding response regulator [Ignatzschineria sp. F8392]|uniref:response regulator n=1 Tax=Ignatzschineria sp. F8392 TaxID=1980117 RepID=UPI000B997536|nr:response regulator [Ignatzschineria sp. F8392]OYQ80497.1 DNA-binding response regulator [Ignatzschineria sp. F8392]
MTAQAKVLFVDDDTELQALVPKILEYEGFETIVKKNGVECLEYLDSFTPDVVILDVMMPEKNGWDTLKEIRKDHPTLPVIILSAKGDSFDRVLGLELGADDYIAKPFDDRELVARIRARLRLQSKISDTNSDDENSDRVILEAHGLILNSAQYRATYNEQPINLTTTEFSVLYYMVQRKGETVSREELSRNVLGKRHQSFDRVIDMHLSNIRKKLPEKDDGLPWFKTVHGLGYLFLE